MYRSCPHCEKSNKASRDTCWHCGQYMGPARAARASGPIYGRAARGSLGSAVYRNNPEEDDLTCEPGNRCGACDDCYHGYHGKEGHEAADSRDTGEPPINWPDDQYTSLPGLRSNPVDEDYEGDEADEDDMPYTEDDWDDDKDPGHHKWANKTYAWKKNPDEEDEDEEIEDIAPSLTPPPFSEDDDEDDDDEDDIEDGEIDEEDDLEEDEDEDEEEDESDSWEAPLADSAHRRNPERSPYTFTYGQEIADKIFSGGNNTLYRRRLRRRNPWRGRHYRRNAAGRAAWGESLYPETGGNWGKPLYRRNACGSDHRKPRRYRRNAAHGGKTVWGGKLFPSTSKSWDPVWSGPLYKRNRLRRRNPRAAWGRTLYPKTGGNWGKPLYRRNASGRAAWGETLYPETGGNWGKPLYRRRNPYDPFAPTKKWTPEMGLYEGEQEAPLEDELEAAASRRWRRRLRRRNPGGRAAGRGAWGRPLYGDGPGAWGPTLYRNPSNRRSYYRRNS